MPAAVEVRATSGAPEDEDKLVLGIFTGSEQVGCAEVILGWPADDTVLLATLLVAEPHQRKGAGTAACRAIEQMVASWRMPKVRVLVPRVIEAVLPFWRTQGFEATGELALYRRGSVSCDAIVLEKRIPGPAAPEVPVSARVTLRTVTKDNVRAVCGLRLKREQERFVAPNAWSVAEAAMEPTAWLRAVYADEVPVGLVLISSGDDDTDGQPYLWRFMIGAPYQGKGFGRAALSLAIEHARSLDGAREILLSYVPGAGAPRPFYVRAGFRVTGRIIDGEIVMSKPLADPRV